MQRVIYPINAVFTVKYLLTILLFISGVASADITGIAHVTDGDTVKINNTRIRLHGIDAPERNQKCEKYGQEWRCGQASTRLLRTLTINKTITCKGRSTDRYKRLIAVCYVNGVDLNAAMVDAGLALAYRKYSTQYVPNEKRAKQAKRGLWSGQFVNPWDWRKGKRLNSTNTAVCCKICNKGKACGNSCISRSYTCHKPPGCACNKN